MKVNFSDFVFFSVEISGMNQYNEKDSSGISR